MPDIPTGSQIFDLVFAPDAPRVYAGLLNGRIRAFAYDEQAQHEDVFTLRPSSKSCRGLAISADGKQLWAVGKAKALVTVDLGTGKLADTRTSAHDSPINRVHALRAHTLATGDDDGVIKLWDTRAPAALRAHTHHFDFISDFLWLEDKKHLVSTSGDGTLSVIDIRSNKTDPLAHSEDQEDELLSILPIRGGSKYVVGTQQGVLSVFNRASGWADCVDRIPGHPHSVDALCALPAAYPSAHSTLLTGSSDGLLRAVQLYPTKLLGAIADHGAFPIERVRVDMGGQGTWVASVGHEEAIKMTDLREVFEDDKEGEGDEEGGDGSDDEDEDKELDAAAVRKAFGHEPVANEEETKSDSDSDSDSPDEPQAPPAPPPQDEDAADEVDSDAELPKEKKRKRKQADPLQAGRRKKGRDQMDAEKGFFSGL